jgi:hypothetical protein
MLVRHARSKNTLVDGRRLVAFISVNNLIWMKFLLTFNILPKKGRIAANSTTWNAAALHLCENRLHNLIIIFLLTDGTVGII